VTAGETLLKISDYPFAYSTVAILTGIFGLSITQNQILFLGIAGAFGTLLTIADPIGLIIRKRLEQIAEGKKSSSLQYEKSAIKSRSIGIEFDRIIGLVYFTIIAILFIVAILVFPDFSENFKLVSPDGETVCDSDCFVFWGLIGAMALAILLGILGTKKWRELYGKLIIAGMFTLRL